MRLYDNYGRLVISYSMDFDLLDVRYVRKDASDTMSGVTYNFDISGTNFRIKSGKAQFKVPTTGKWHTMLVEEENGTRYVELEDIGES